VQASRNCRDWSSAQITAAAANFSKTPVLQMNEILRETGQMHTLTVQDACAAVKAAILKLDAAISKRKQQRTQLYFGQC
jgi:hypothetical protein